MAFKDSTDEKFSDQINGSKLSLIQFSASWCGPCQQLKPIVEKISNDMSDKIDCYCLLYTSPSPRDSCASRMPSSA